MTTFDLRRHRLRPGEEHREALEVELPPLELGGQRYTAIPENVEAQLTATRATTGTAFALAFTVRLHGPGCGCPEAEDLQVAPRQAAGDARDRSAASLDLPAVRLAEAVAPRLPDLRNLQGPRAAAAHLPPIISASRRGRRPRGRSSPG